MNTTRVQLKISKKQKAVSVVSPRIFNPDFLKSLARSEEQFLKGQVSKIETLEDLLI